MNNEIIEELGRFVKKFNKLARDVDLTPSQLALGWVVSQEGVTTTITGSKEPSHIRENAHAVPLKKEIVKAIEELQKEFESESFSTIETTVVDTSKTRGVTMGLLEVGAWIDVPPHTKIGEKIQIDALDGSKKYK